MASFVWATLGQPKHFIEPFFGSGAVLLARPDWTPGMIETVNDLDGHVCNVWRSLQLSPDVVARWCDWPVTHCDLSARKKAIIAATTGLRAGLAADDTWHDPKIAGYWVWAASCWIGSGLTRPNAIPHIGTGGRGVHALGQIPHIGTGGRGVHALGQIPHIGTGGRGVHALGQIPHVSDGGKGVHALGQVPHVSDGGKGVQEPYNTNLYAWFRSLSERLRYVRCVSGDWTQVCGGNWQDKCGDVGIFFDPPYGAEATRDDAIYEEDSQTVAADVRAWCLERGANPRYRIVLAGYAGEHEALADAGWTSQAWSARGGYSNTARNGATRGQANRHREVLWLSPSCKLAGNGPLFMETLAGSPAQEVA